MSSTKRGEGFFIGDNRRYAKYRILLLAISPVYLALIDGDNAGVIF